MQREGDEVHFETDEARGASTPNIVRWVLAVSLFAAIALLSLIWIAGAATQGEAEGEGTADGRERLLQEYGARGGILSSSPDDTDSNVADRVEGIDAPEPGATSQPGAPPTVENEAADAAPPTETGAN